MSNSSLFGNSPVPFDLSYLKLGQLQKELEKKGLRPEPVGTEKCDDGNTKNGDGCKGDGTSQDTYSNVIGYSTVKVVQVSLDRIFPLP